MSKLIHAATILSSNGPQYLFLRQVSDHEFTWFIEVDGQEQKTGVTFSHVEEAIRLANKKWMLENFTPLNCGFRYTLPERDEHGNNALFHQMVSSYSSMNGVYFDVDLGRLCIVQNAPSSTRALWKKWSDKLLQEK